MSCRWTYKTYELTGKKPSRQKKYYHKKRKSKITQEGPSFEPTQELAEEQQADNSGPGPVDQTQATAGPECSDTPTDTSTDDEVSVEPPKHKKKRKVKTSGKSEDEPFPLSSDDPFSSDTASESEQPHSLINAEPQTLPRQVAALQANQIFDADSSDDCQENVGSNSNGKEGEPLCNCTKTTVGDVMFMTLALGLRHGLSWDAQVDILKMISTVFVDKKIPLSKNTYISKLQAMEDSDIEYHVYCKKCDTYMGKRDACERFCHDCHKVYTNTSESEIVESCEDCHILLGERQVKAQVRYCSNKTCGAEIKFAAADNLLISVSIESQLQKFVKDENFVNNVMQYRFSRQYIPGVYSDVYDGAMYQKHFVNNGILSSPYNFSYTFFADGIPYSKSGQKTVWPIYLTINELPYEERRKYYILAAVYCGDKEPNEQWFFPAFVKQANHLSMNGFQWNHNGKSVTSRVLPLCLVADSGARHKLINMQSYGAIYGCTFCYIETEKIGAQRYLININESPPPLRTPASYKHDLAEVDARKDNVQEKNRVYRGVRGVCVLNSLKFFCVIESCVVDYFHCMLIGVTKKHMDLILKNKYKSFWNGMKDNIGVDKLIACIDAGIKNIQSTTSVIRELRPLKDIANWKASEYRSWLLFYCIVCLKGFLKKKHLEHLALLSKAANLLLQKTVTHYHIETAFRLFKMYTVIFQEVFDEHNMTYNIHLLSHIPTGVLSFGPLWTHNSFTYESKNRHILQLVKSPHHVPYQIARKFFVYQSLPILSSAFVRCKEVVLFCDKLLNYKHLAKYDRASDINCVLLGTPKLEKLSESDLEKLSTVLDGCGSKICFNYERMYYKRKRYTTNSYGKGKKNNDSFAFLDSGECVKILNISRFMDQNRVVLYVEKINILEKNVVELPEGRYDQVLRAADSRNKFMVMVERLDRPCFRLKIRSKQYISNIPYACTVE